MWFFYAMLTMAFWGTADLFYKTGADEEEKYSHLRTSVSVGIVMGVHAIITLIFGNVGYDFRNMLVYLPVSFMYILSMTVGYFGLRYLELSISSPIQNTSGALVSLLCFFILGQKLDIISGVGIIFICIGVFLLGLLEKNKENEIPESKKYKIGFIAFFMPIIYCVIDSLGTFFDAYYLDSIEKTPLLCVSENTLEDVANISYELTFFAFAIILSLYLFAIKKQKIVLHGSKSRLSAALFETGGQFVYVRAMSGNGVVAAPMIASYSIVSVILSRLFLKEKLTKTQYFIISIVIFGIVLLGVSEGLAE